MSIIHQTRRRFVHAVACTACLAILTGRELSAAQKQKARPGRSESPPPTHPPLEPVEITRLPEGTSRLDLFLLMGQSNMKGRGLMPEVPKHDPRLVMMHMKDDHWYLARHPLHLTGDAKTFADHDNAGVGSGLSFAETVAAGDPKVRIGLIPCAVGGTQIVRWEKGAKLYEDAVRRGKLALKETASLKARICAALWLQGEADSTDERLPVYEGKLLKMVDDLRKDLDAPELPFIACTIGEMRDDEGAANRRKMNELLLSLPKKRPHTACVDARDLKSNIGDNVHFDTAAQNEIGRRFAAKYASLKG